MAGCAAIGAVGPASADARWHPRSYEPPNGRAFHGVSGTVGKEHDFQRFRHWVGAHPAVLQAGLRQVQLDVTGLEFLNSAGIKALVNWLLIIKQLAPASRYFIVLQYDEGITWQGKGLKPLACVAPAFLRLEPLH